MVLRQNTRGSTCVFLLVIYTYANKHKHHDIDMSDPSQMPQLEDVLKGLLQYLTAIAKPGATTNDDTFKEALASSKTLTDQRDVEAALHGLANTPPSYWTAVVSQASPRVRSSLHAQILLLGETLSSRVPVYAQTTTLLRLLIYRILPSISSLPEDDQYGTSEELTRHFKSLAFLSGVIQPIEEIPAVKDINKKLKDAISREAFMSGELEHARGRMKQLGITLTDKTANGSKDEEAAIKVLLDKKSVAPAKYKTFAVLFGIVAALFFILAVVLICLYVSKCKRTKACNVPLPSTGANAPGDDYTAAFGGAVSKTTTPIENRYLMSGADTNADSLW